PRGKRIDERSRFFLTRLVLFGIQLLLGTKEPECLGKIQCIIASVWFQAYGSPKRFRRSAVRFRRTGMECGQPVLIKCLRIWCWTYGDLMTAGCGKKGKQKNQKVISEIKPTAMHVYTTPILRKCSPKNELFAKCLSRRGDLNYESMTIM